MIQSDKIKAAVTDNEVSSFNARLAYFGIVDIGVIKERTSAGRVTVVSCTQKGDAFITYRNVEVIYPGCDTGAFKTTNVGSMCLILIPRSCVPTLSSKKIKINKGTYHNDGVKALPITNGSNTNVSLNFDDEGALNVVTSTYHAVFAPDHISANLMKSLRILIDRQGQFFYTHDTPSHALYMAAHRLDTIEYSFMTKNRALLHKFIINEDGSVDISETDAGGDTVYRNINIGIDGSITITGAGDMSITNDKVQVSVTGTDANISNESGSISLDSDGTVTINNHLKVVV